LRAAVLASVLASVLCTAACRPAAAADPVDGPADIIVAFAEDPHRTLAAARLQRQRPRSRLFIQGSRSLLELSERRLKAAGLWSESPPQLLELRGTCDTVGQLTELATLLERSFRPGRLTLVTSRPHLTRSLAIARPLTARRGWSVAGLPVDAGFVAPQHPLSTPRDVLRSLLWRLTGWHGRLSPCSQHLVEASR
jgi:uncharacterized SAM-binding protein YcdF (DUF218 family)